MSNHNVTIVHVRPAKPLTNRARDAPLARPPTPSTAFSPSLVADSNTHPLFCVLICKRI